jgi:hypothetical protein
LLLGIKLVVSLLAAAFCLFESLDRTIYTTHFI